jgi:hypothetical protein
MAILVAVGIGPETIDIHHTAVAAAEVIAKRVDVVGPDGPVGRLM